MNLRKHYGDLGQATLELGEHAAGAKAAQNLAATFSASAADCLLGATLLASCVSQAERDEQLSELQRTVLMREYAAQAVRLLRDGSRKALTDGAQLGSDPKLAALRSHPGFKELVAELSAKTATSGASPK